MSIRRALDRRQGVMGQLTFLHAIAGLVGFGLACCLVLVGRVLGESRSARAADRASVPQVSDDVERVAGDVTLAELVQSEGPLPAGRAIPILRKVCSALEAVHRDGLVHRDVKPDNIVIDSAGGVRLMDFGLVCPVDGAREEDDVVVGTPQYMAPETILAPADVDGRSDLYALGGVAYFLLTGRRPFEGETVVEVLSRALYTEPAAPSALCHTIPAELERLVLSCLAKRPADRPASAAELDRALARCADKPITDIEQVLALLQASFPPLARYGYALRACTQGAPPARAC